MKIIFCILALITLGGCATPPPQVKTEKAAMCISDCFHKADRLWSYFDRTYCMQNCQMLDKIIRPFPTITPANSKEN